MFRQLNSVLDRPCSSLFLGLVLIEQAQEQTARAAEFYCLLMHPGHKMLRLWVSS